MIDMHVVCLFPSTNWYVILALIVFFIAFYCYLLLIHLVHLSECFRIFLQLVSMRINRDSQST